MPMAPGSLGLHADSAASFRGSDGRFQVDVPAGSVSSADLGGAGRGSLSLRVSQVAPASGSTAGGGGRISFGTYLLQLVDGAGQPARRGLRRQVTLTLHYDDVGGAVDLAHTFVVLDAAMPASTAATDRAALERSRSMPTSLDLAARTVSAAADLPSASTTVAFDTDAPVAAFGAPDPFNVDLNAGGLSFELPIDVPAGPGGLKPPLSLSYSSDAVSESHNVQAAAPWVGEGWNLSLGSITWAEHDVTTACGTCGTEWESSWQLTDAAGRAVDLVPPNINVSTYYDDTPNVYYASSSRTYPNEPEQWHTSPDSHSLIYSYVGPNTLPAVPAHPSCFRVYRADGEMEEYGCTPDSVEYYFVPSNLNSQYIARWALDLVTDPRGNQVHITYQSHLASLNHVSYTRDVEPATVEWDSPGCHDADHACTGSAWAPLMRVNFVAGQSPARSVKADGNPCNTGPLMRCDDPLDLSSSGGVAAPEVQSTFALDDLQVQVRGSGAGAWSTLRDYQFSYEVGGPGQMTDPVSGRALSYAGIYDLTQVQEVGDDGQTSLPSHTFGYRTMAQHYEDTAFHASPSTNCGPSWNAECFLWNDSRDGNSRYLSSASNGLGLSQSFAWSEARNNTHGVNIGSPLDPLACTVHGSSGYPCSQVDDQNWSHVVLTGRSDSVVRPSSAGSVTVISSTAYSYLLTALTASPCANCKVGMYWGNQNDADYLDYYNGRFMGFAQATTTNPDGSVVAHHFGSTSGWGVYDTAQVRCFTTSACHSAPWWSPANALHGREVEQDRYDTDGTTLLDQVRTQYQLACPSPGVAGTPASSFGNWDGNLVASLDHNNPVAVCDVHPSQVDTYTFDGASASLAVPHRTVSYAYDRLGNATSITTTTNDGGVHSSPTTMVEHNDYISNDSVKAAWDGVSGTHIVDALADSLISDAGNTVHRDCRYVGYDGSPFATGQQPTLKFGEATTDDRYTDCGTSSNGFATSGQIRTTTIYDPVHGDPVGSTDADANAGVPAHTGCAAGGTTLTTCVAYDGTFAALPVQTANALDQAAQIGYTAGAQGGFGTWPTSVTDQNGQTSAVGFDGLGRVTGISLPGETAGQTTSATTYTFWCSATGAQAPCAEIDTTQRLDSGFTTTSRAFYDGRGDLVETREPAPGGRDVVRYAFYDPSDREVFLSSPYFVTAYTGPPGAAAFSTPDAGQPGITITHVNLRQTVVKDPLSDTVTTSIGVGCADIAADPACYARTTVIDALGHRADSYDDSLGEEVYSRSFSGGSGATYAPYATTTKVYDLPRRLTAEIHPDGVSATTFTYDDAGRVTTMSDPDRGTESYGYDPNGNLIRSVDARGAAGTVFIGYDGLDRPTWRNTSNGLSGAYVTFSYDSAAGGNQGVGRLTGETFSGGPGLTLAGSRSHQYDGRGRDVLTILTVGGASYGIGTTYNDADQVLSETYPSGETVTYGRTPEGWLQDVSRQLGGVTTLIVGDMTYTGPGGAMGEATGASLANGVYRYLASHDLLGRLTDTGLTRAADGAALFDQARTFDGAGNVTSASTTLPQGTDTQRFCYDEQDRLTWAGSVGTPPCTGAGITPGTLTQAEYSQGFAYDVLDRLTSGTAGSYTYGDAAHLHAVTGIGSTYSASYDAAGNMICRTVTGGTGCSSGAQAGARMSYDSEGQLAAWQSPAGTPPSQTGDLYDGEGHRMEQQVTSGGTTTTTVFVENVEEVTTGGAASTTTAYYYAGDQRVALAVDGQLSWLATDGLGSATVALDAAGNPEASGLYAPYGTVRYASGAMPTDFGFTGQRADAATGLDYYGARYYDPVAGQFTTGDTVLSSLNLYGYADGSPVTLTDPTGHMPGPGGGGQGERQGPTAGQVVEAIVGIGAIVWNLLMGGPPPDNNLPEKPAIERPTPGGQGEVPPDTKVPETPAIEQPAPGGPGGPAGPPQVPQPPRMPDRPKIPGKEKEKGGDGSPEPEDGDGKKPKGGDGKQPKERGGWPKGNPQRPDRGHKPPPGRQRFAVGQLTGGLGRPRIDPRLLVLSDYARLPRQQPDPYLPPPRICYCVVGPWSRPGMPGPWIPPEFPIVPRPIW